MNITNFVIFHTTNYSIETGITTNCSIKTINCNDVKVIMWNFSAEVQPKLEIIKKHNLSQFDNIQEGYDQEKWQKLFKCFGTKFATNFTDRIPHSQRGNCIQYHNQEQASNRTYIKYSNEEVSYITNRMPLESNDDNQSITSVQVSQTKSIVNNDYVENLESLQVFSKYVNKEWVLTEDELHEVFQIAINADDKIDYMMQALNKYLESTPIYILYKIFIRVNPNNFLIKSFLNNIIKPRVLATEKSRHLDQFLISCYQQFTKETINFITIPILLNFEEKRKSTLLSLINSASDKDKNYILNVFIDHGNLSLEQMPVLEKIITIQMDSPLIKKLIGFIYKFKDDFSKEPLFGIFLLNIVKAVVPRIKVEDKTRLMEIVGSISSIHKRAIMKILSIN